MWLPYTGVASPVSPTVNSSGSADSWMRRMSTVSGITTIAAAFINAPKRARYKSTAASSTSPTLRGRSSGITRQP